jgi:CTP synthase (UTP-ammonia lyase)
MRPADSAGRAAQALAVLQCARGKRDPALDVPHIYDVPLAYHEEGLDDEVLAAFGIDRRPAPIWIAGKRFPTG